MLRLASFLPVADDSPFSINNIPFGIFSTKSNPVPRPGAAIGTFILDLKALVEAEVFEKHCEFKFPFETLRKTTLNSFAALGREVLTPTRLFLQQLLLDTNPILRDDPKLRGECLVQQKDATMHLPVSIGDFTDFLNSRVHATNTHSSHASPVNMFSPPRAFPGRVSSIVVSGTPIVRPLGHLYEKGNSGKTVIEKTDELDVEVELAYFIGKPSKHFKRIPITEAEDHIFGVVMLNDWSTRDIQRGEDFPFGAFNAKNFASTISPWVVTLDALEPFRTKPQPRVKDDVLPYLDDPEDSTYDIPIKMDWKLADTGETFEATRTNLVNTYWTFKQMLTFQTLAGCPMRTGDLIGTGTMTGADPSSYCSLVEKTKQKTVAITSPQGTTRYFVEDGDEINYTAWGGSDLKSGGVGFGECRGVILPADI